ncbi:MAG: hypothetical protein UHM85_08350 [Acutalibacteraceae bacterium]|nr:hypothetical protein [Acutalibacteraceae bacterium]
MKKADKLSLVLSILSIGASLLSISYFWIKPFERMHLSTISIYLYFSFGAVCIGIMFLCVYRKIVKNAYKKHITNKSIWSYILIVLIVSFGTVVVSYSEYSSYQYDWLTEKDGLGIQEYVPYNDRFNENRAGYEGKCLIERDYTNGTKLIKINNYFSPVSAYDELNYCVEYLETDSILLNSKFNFDKSTIFSDGMRVKSMPIEQEIGELKYNLYVNDDDYALKINNFKSTFYVTLVNTQEYNIVLEDFVNEALEQYFLLAKDRGWLAINTGDAMC